MIVAISSRNSNKTTTFDLDERIRLVEENLTPFDNVKVSSFEGLLVDYAQKVNAQVLVRGLRAVSGFEYEFQMAQMNRHLDSNLETIFLMPNEKYFYTSSQLIKQVHLFGDRQTDLVPSNVADALKNLSRSSTDLN